MPPAPPSQQQGDGNDALWVIAGIIIAVVLIWYFGHQWIVFVIFKLKYIQASLLQYFVPSLKPIVNVLGHMSFDQDKEVDYMHLIAVCNAVGEYLRYPLIAVLIILAGILYFGNVSLRYRNTYSMQKLASEEQMNWPQTMPVIHLDLINTPLDQMPWAMALNPMQFAKKYKLLQVEKLRPEGDQLSKAIKVNVKLKRNEAKQVFLTQLGNYWHGHDALPPHTKALFALFAAKAHGEKDAVMQINNQIAISISKTGQANYQGIDALIAKYAHVKAVKQITEKHAFVYTVMASMLEFARQDGVYASADFIWLKPIDRRLWYTLNCVGRKTPFAEVAGIFAHYYAEQVYQQAIYVPSVDEAVNALEIAIAEFIYKPDEV